MTSVKELKQQAKAKGIKGYYKMRKAELMKVLNIAPMPRLTKTKFAPGVQVKKQRKIKVSDKAPLPKKLSKAKFAPGVKILK